LLLASPSHALRWGAAQASSDAELQTAAPTGRIIVKLTDASGLSVSGGALVPATSDAARLSSLLSITASEFRLERHFGRSAEAIDAEREAAERKSGIALPNLNRYARLSPLHSPSRDELILIVKVLVADPAVETAFLEPVAVPAALGFDAFTGRYEPISSDGGPGGRPTPDFTPLQGYLDPPPLGVDAEGVWATPGGKGETVKVVDIEGAWLWSHEDLPAPFFTAGGEVPYESWRNHGTAVLGEIRGTVNGYGVTGISHEVEVGAASIWELSVAEAINEAAAAIEVGDIYLIELHGPGPNADGNGQYGYVCMEFWQDNFDAILIATANGRICCEAAGNGQQDFDDPVYMGLFDRNVRDSGAIICGASNGGSLDPAGFTNYGARVDLHGWGYDVVTSGYGNLQGGPEEEWYTDSFSGTSSASPIVVGSVASLQGMTKAAFGIPLTAKVARDILVATGTPQTGSNHIGPRPDLQAALALAQTGIGAVAGVVTDDASGDPVPDVTVSVAENGSFAMTAADGSYFMSMLADDYTLEFTSFFYSSAVEPATVSAGDTTELNVALVMSPTVEVGGRILGDDGLTGLAGVRVTPWDAPLPGTHTDADGYWGIPGFPVDRTYAFHADSLPGMSADFDSVYAAGPLRADVYFELQLVTALEDFEADDGGFSADALWSHGTPTAGGPSSGFSGSKCWGVGMDDDYPDDAHGTLTSPAYDYSGESELRLSFHYWSETEMCCDGTRLEIWNTDTSDWDLLVPLTGYPSLCVGGVPCRAGWAGSTDGWVGAVFDLVDYISDEVRFRIHFGSDGSVVGPGFWIDDIAFDTGDAIVDVADGGVPAGLHLLHNAPNPFNPVTRIAFELPVSGHASIAIFDAGGRIVRHLHDGPLPAGQTRLVWDGLDDRGSASASGVYFVRLNADGREVSRRMVLAR